MLLAAAMTAGIFASVPVAAKASKTKLSLKQSSVTLNISEKNGKAVYGSAAVGLKTVKGVTVKKTTLKTLSPKVVVTTKTKVKAVAAGTGKVAVGVKFTYKKHTYNKQLILKVKVADSREDSVFRSKLSGFSNNLYAMSAKSAKGNYTMSPLSAYMALAMIHAIGDANVKSEVEALTKMSADDFNKTAALCKSLTKERKDMYGEVYCKLSLTNSIWLDDSQSFNKEALKPLEKNLSCFAKNAPFRNDNSAANEQVQKFISDNTNGLINQNFGISEETLMALINTLYFKDNWNESGSDLQTEKRNFKTPSGFKKTEFLKGHYEFGRTASTDVSTYYYTKTNSGYKIKLILPKKGHTVKEAMSAHNLNIINKKADFKPYDADGTEHYTRCIFPSFKIESDTPLAQILKSNQKLSNAFSEFSSELTDEKLKISDIKHKAVLDVNKKGVEGAAVTIALVCASSAPIPVKKVYHDFVLGRSFGYIITDPNDVVLFEGQVKNP